MNEKRITPHSGFQADFLSSPADIAIGGGSAGAGKTHALLMEVVRNANVPRFTSVIFRRTYPQIKAGGGLWDTSMELYGPLSDAKPNETGHEWRFSSGAKVKFSHLEYEKNKLDWQGSQIPLICFDELTHFSKNMFFYLLSRNRSTCGVKPYVRATCNPDPDSWVAKFIEWWIDQDTGFPIKERSGVLRYFIKDKDSYVWGDSKDEVLARVPHIIDPLLAAEPGTNPHDLVKSLTFIPGSIYENVELLRVDPGYLGNLMAQDEETKAQLLDGNWKIRIDGTDLINYVKMQDAFSNSFVRPGLRCVTADIAFEGSDLFIMGAWDGFRLIDIDFMEKSKGPEIISRLKAFCNKHKVPQSRVVYDDDGAGAFIDGFIEGARAFNNGSKARKRQNYKNLKAQCYYKFADRVDLDGYYISPDVASRKIKGKTFKQRVMHERRGIKKDKPDQDGKRAIMPKDQVKNIIGHSPDILDMMMMREYFEFITLLDDKMPGGKSALGLP
ncbi:MAG: terminase family protein [Deltaproteobacteria bacterium]|jgi:hypothetical protein|nr:terminase family protein [Deltaproteobacteria bacterium]